MNRWFVENWHRGFRDGIDGKPSCAADGSPGCQTRAYAQGYADGQTRREMNIMQYGRPRI